MSALKMVKNNHDREREARKKAERDSNERDAGCFKQEEECGQDPPERPRRRGDPAGKTPKSTV